MKILQINCNYITTALHQNMMEHLQKQGINSTVVAPTSNINNSIIEINENVVVCECFTKIDRLLYFLKQRKIRNSIIKKIAISDYQCIHAYTLFTDGNCARYLSKKYGIPYVVAVRDTDINTFFKIKPYLIPLGLKIMKDASAVFFLSEAYKQQMLDKYVPAKYKRALEDKMLVVPNGIDDFWINNHFTEFKSNEQIGRIKQRRIKAICVAKIIKRKNIPFIVDTLEKMNESGWNIELEVIGKVDNEDEFDRIKSSPIVQYYPPMNKEELIEHYRKADIFVLLSHTETFGLVYAEALSQGLPIIYSKGQGFDGHFQSGYIGYAVSSTREDELMDAINRVVDNYEELHKNTKNAYKSFVWDDICRKYVNVYEKNISSL